MTTLIFFELAVRRTEKILQSPTYFLFGSVFVLNRVGEFNRSNHASIVFGMGGIHSINRINRIMTLPKDRTIDIGIALLGFLASSPVVAITSNPTKA